MRLNPHISVDCVVFGFDYKYLKVLLVERELVVGDSAEKRVDLKLPGALIADEEELDDAANRILLELTGLTDIYLKRYDVFGSKSRMQNPIDVQWLQDFTGLQIERVITVAFYSLIKIDEVNPEGNLHGKAHWVNINDLPVLPFDHNQIVAAALANLRKELRAEPVGFELLPKKFSIRQVQNLYEVILGIRLDNRNFRKRFLKLSYVKVLKEKERNVNHKPAMLYRFDRKEYEKRRDRMLEFLM